MPTNQYTIPEWGTSTDRLLGWCLEARQEGAAWLAAQRPAVAWEGAVSLMQEADQTTESSSMSNTVYPKAKRIARELVASLASFEHEGEFRVLWDNSLYDQAHLLTDLDRNWYETCYPGDAHRMGLQNAVVKGTGYWLEEWDKHFWGPYKGDIRLTSLDPADVTFVQLPRDRDIQRAYSVIIRYELPINLARRIYAETNPGFAAALVPDQETPSWLEKGLQKVQQFLSPALRVAGRTRQNASGSFPTVNIYHMYTVDGSVNRGFDPVQMGVKGTNWEYTVPSVGSPLPTGIMNPATGAQFTRPATERDCLMFPLRRLTVFSNTGVASDDSSPYWHGDVPVTRIWFNDWPWEALGGSLVSDLRTIEQGINALMRGMEDSAAARLDPPMLYDDNMGSSWAKAVNPRLAGGRAAAPLNQVAEPIKPILPPAYYDVPQWIAQFISTQEDRMNYLSGVTDLAAMAKARQIPSADTLEKLLEMAGPLQQDMVRALEKPLTQLGEWRKAMYFQFYNAARVIRTVGPDEFDPDIWKSQPDRLEEIRKHSGYRFDPGELAAITPGQSPQDRSLQLRRLISAFQYVITESGINELYRMTTKLTYLQLTAQGQPLSWWTIAKIFKIPNFGPPPEGTNTELERFIAQKHIQIDLQVDLQKELAQAMPEGQAGPGATGEPGQIPPVSGFGEEHRGRPQTFHKAPRIQQKDHGARSTVTTA